MTEDAAGPLLPGATDWVWLVDDSVLPTPDALERLLAAVEPLGTPDGLIGPILLASKVVTETGALDPGSLPVAEVGRFDLVVAAYERRLVALRLARRGSLLIHRRAFAGASAAAPSVLDPDLTWTARLLRRELGLLVPGSVVVRIDGAGRAWTPAASFRLLTGDALAPREKPRFAFRLAEEGVAAARARLGRAAAGERGAAHHADRG